MSRGKIAAMQSSRLIERGAEIASLRALLDRASQGNGAAGLIEGEAGIGKSSLLQAACDHASASGLAVQRARGTEAERAYGYGGIRQLFEARLATADPHRQAALLSGPAASAAAAIGLAESAEGTSPDEFAVQRGLYWLLDALCAEQPILLVVDDAQWIDRPSLDAVLYLARRIDDLRAALLLGWRVGEPGDQSALHALSGEPNLQTLRPQRLSEDGTRALVEAVRPDVSPSVVRACHEATGGNPFLATELAHALPDGADPAQVPTMGPDAVLRSVSRRLARVTPAARALAQGVAVLDVSADARSASMLAGLDSATALRALDELLAARLFAPGAPLRFAHPLLRAAVYESLGPGQRSIAHREAAGVLAAQPATADRAATHLLSVEPAGDPWVVAQLRAAAAHVVASGAPASAIALLERARREPAGDADAEVLCELGHAQLLAEHEDALPTLRKALDATGSTDARGAVIVDLVLALGADECISEAVALLQDEATRAEALRPDLALQLRSMLAVGLSSDDTVEDAARTIAALVATDIPDSAERRRLLITHAYARAHVGQGDFADIAADLAPGIEREGWWREHSGIAVSALYGGLATLVWTGQVELARQVADAANRDAERTGDRWQTAGSAFWQSHTAFLLGDLPAAEEAGWRVIETPHPGSFMRQLAPAALIQALVARGRLDEADRVLAVSDLMDVEPNESMAGAWMAYARCGLHLARGRRAEAFADSLALAAYVGRRGGAPPGWGGVGIDATIAQAPELAAAVSERLLERAHAWGEPGWLGVALCNNGRVIGGAEGMQRLDAGVKLLQETPLRIELASGLLALGRALNRAGHRKDAQRALEQSVDLAHHCGAVPLRNDAQEELRIAGARPRRFAITGVESLTAAEYRVVRMAADGLSNSEICQSLFLTRSTVEKQLTAAYRKLAITSRSQLAAVLAAG